MKTPSSAKRVARTRIAGALFRILFKVIHEIPKSTPKETSEALIRARKLISETSLKAAAISGALALPFGPSGWLRTFRDLAAIWRLQAQMVADIGALLGKKGKHRNR